MSQQQLVLPKGWIEVNFPDVIFFQEGPGLRTYQFTEKGMKAINVKNIVKGKLDISNTKKHIDLAEFKKTYSHFKCSRHLCIVCHAILEMIPIQVSVFS